MLDRSLNQDVGRVAKACKNWAEVKNDPTKAILNPWPVKSTDSGTAIQKLRETFARFGLPQQLVSDNATAFISQEFQKFVNCNGINHLRGAPYHPQTNGTMLPQLLLGLVLNATRTFLKSEIFESFFKMPRKSKPRKIGLTPANTMSRAVYLVLNENYSVRQAAVCFNVQFQALARYVRTQCESPEVKVSIQPNYTHRQIFSNEKELNVAEYLQIYETGTTTVQNPKTIIATKGAKQVNHGTSGERGELVTTCAIISAVGTYIPPVIIFPQKFFKPHMLKRALPGSMGLATPSGNSTNDNPSLLIYDNHESHISINVVNKARKAGVQILTLPPHCSNRLQSLDVSVFVNALRKHLKKPSPLRLCYQDLRKQVQIPFNPNAFNDTDFLSSAVMVRPENVPSDGPSKEPVRSVLIQRKAQKIVSKKTKQNIKSLQAKNKPKRKKNFKYVRKKADNYDSTSEDENIAYEELSETETWESEETDYDTISEGRYSKTAEAIIAADLPETPVLSHALTKFGRETLICPITVQGCDVEAIKVIPLRHLLHFPCS
ncbi:hypothetical protein ILUMI_01764 [Ignelater luminosus]|uniref:Integrase catalytic domain-containing protein n=1 Tax=Ignelater luminosus TaxID=2038154 RepID=A0A8K0DJL3_IGNLU|nr:hypothetical protein ILUMI_01764 [Ignelater luminosus]